MTSVEEGDDSEGKVSTNSVLVRNYLKDIRVRVSVERPLGFDIVVQIEQV